MSTPAHYRAPLVLNLLAAICVAVLIGLGVYVNQIPLLAEGTSTNGFTVIATDQNSWNVGCTVLGTAIGMLLAWAFASHDGLLTRREILHSHGVLALYLRPLSPQRGLLQLRRRQFPLMRTVLVLSGIISTLTSAATVAVFGIHTDNIDITNPLASFSLAQLADQWGEQQADMAIFPVRAVAEIPLLSGFLYRSAYIRSLQAKGTYNPISYKETWAPESGPIGDTIYPRLNTSGIGLNTTSYTQYSGLPSGYNLPTSYVFQRLDAMVYGTKVDVACSNATASYTVTTTQLGTFADDIVLVYNIAKENFPNTTLIQGRAYEFNLVIGSVVTEQQGAPLHTFIFTEGVDNPPFIVECTYGGNEMLASVSLVDRVSPIQVNSIVNEGPPFDASVKWKLSNVTHEYIYDRSHGAPGGALAEAWASSRFYDGGFLNDTDTPQLMSTILSELGEAYFSLLRQNVEIANNYRSSSQQTDNGSTLTMIVAVLRVGGASYAWLAIYGLLFAAAVLGVVGASSKKPVLPWESQNPVEILQRSLPHSSIDDLTPLSYGEKFETLHSNAVDRPARHQGERNMSTKMGAVEDVTTNEV